MKWIKIKRDKDGFATNETLDKMHNSLPIVVLIRYIDPRGWEDIYTEYIDEETWDKGEIDSHTKYTDYLKVPAITPTNFDETKKR